MKIIAGTFGSSGSASIDRNEVLRIKSAKIAEYESHQVESIVASMDRQKKFGWIGFILGAIILSAAFSMFIGALGFVIGIALAIAGSFYTQKSERIDIKFNDGNFATIGCTSQEAKDLVRFKT